MVPAFLLCLWPRPIVGFVFGPQQVQPVFCCSKTSDKEEGGAPRSGCCTTTLPRASKTQRVYFSQVLGFVKGLVSELAKESFQARLETRPGFFDLSRRATTGGPQSASAGIRLCLLKGSLALPWIVQYCAPLGTNTGFFGSENALLKPTPESSGHMQSLHTMVSLLELLAEGSPSKVSQLHEPKSFDKPCPRLSLTFQIVCDTFGAC